MSWPGAAWCWASARQCWQTRAQARVTSQMTMKGLLLRLCLISRTSGLWLDDLPDGRRGVLWAHCRAGSGGQGAQ
ncbi:hypothetical protein JCM18918_2606 [Cutibacterium acnes JCM 18918]|nr:hypothetical protein JCM18918_2606 [Cutibacterium acnes JCM 18918]